MTAISLKEQIMSDMKHCMRAQEKERLAIIRLIQAAIKQREIDERITLDDTEILRVLEKMAKQRRESIEQFTKAQRDDLVAQEEFELALILQYLPEPLSEEEVTRLVSQAIVDTSASTIKDMNKVMTALKSPLQGRADIAKVSALVKSLLS